MTIQPILAFVYSTLCAGVIAFQFALIAGAPWGHLTQGGGNDGPLPIRGRIAAGISVFLLAAMSLSILSAAGLWPSWPIWTGWASIALQTVVTLLNWVTPSVPERKLWGPITTVMLVLATAVVIGTLQAANSISNS